MKLNPTFENLRETLRMFTIRFKNPYNSKENAISEDENSDNYFLIAEMKMTMPKFSFKGMEDFFIFHFDQVKILSTKGKFLINNL